MASGLAPLLPLTTDSVFGAYNLITDFEIMVRQNLKMLILTCPGERVMDTEFGVGLRRMLFESNTPDTYSRIDSDVRSQVQRYMPFVRIDRIDFHVPEGNADIFPHTINMIVNFNITPLGSFGMLEIDVAGGGT